MHQQEILDFAPAQQKRASKILKESGIAKAWEQNGCRVNNIGSLRMELLASYREMDLHVYSKGFTEENNLAIAAKIAKCPDVTEIKCINGFHT